MNAERSKAQPDLAFRAERVARAAQPGLAGDYPHLRSEAIRKRPLEAIRLAHSLRPVRPYLSRRGYLARGAPGIRQGNEDSGDHHGKQRQQLTGKARKRERRSKVGVASMPTGLAKASFSRRPMTKNTVPAAISFTLEQRRLHICGMISPWWPSNRVRKDGDKESIIQLPVGRNVATRRVHKKAIYCKAWNEIVDSSATPPTANSNPIEALMPPAMNVAYLCKRVRQD